ncbi:probable disease resistance protein At4g27220 isoform X1 [Hevea brasiliensis]|uniref:probable disease resistance protein At4g27220 isoform X1 n=1 Tax=Hevea brasiliensis TaxID=3981 RepID=UPI0025F2FBDE|nr:probable disease resistance protein At4g27220 isoform X1 [Hevea brasiliensis]XP_057991815.1 probable disease resistance protein At4g27220 isoform X1 [Hevea brasiliensis]
MALDTILAIVPMIVEYTFVPVKRHLSYAFNCRSKVEKLKNQVENLKNQRDGLKPHVDEATRRGDEIYANVRNWLTSVDEAIGEADDLVVDEEQARERCFLGLIPNLKKRYKLSKKVEKKAQTVAELREKCKFDLDRIACRPSLWQIVPPSVYNNEVLHSRISILEKVMNALRDPAFNMIGVYGLGGVGKTTLAKEVRRKAIEDKLFDVVLMVTVSETPELRKIQGTIADMLGLELKEETEEGRACRLRQRLLKEKKILVILDDIWEQLEPEKLGIPFGNDHKGCKIFLTSRREDILSRDMGTQESFELRVLSEAEAWSLFVTVVGDVTNQDLRSIASEVAKKCAGLPVLIVTVAGALKNRDLNEWNVALKELSKVDNEGIQSKVYATLKLSYNHLANEELKSFFLLCAQIAQSDIQIRDLLLYSMGLDLLRGKDTVADARNKVYKLVRDLKASCLLLDGDRNGSLKMHDVVRDTALDIASKSQHSFTFRDVVETKEWPNRDFRSCSRIALPSCEIHELPERLECPKLELLVLGRGSIHSKGPDLNISDIFFEGITKLKVLHFTGMCLRSLPPSLRYLTNLLTLCLDECVLRDASVIGELKRLEVLSFRRSMIEELPREIAHLTGLKLLDLSDCDKLKVIPANVISRLSLLEELYMRNSFGQWELQGLNSSNNASLAELKNLSRLTTLEIDVPDVEMLPKDLFSNKLERYDIVIGKKRHRYDEYLSSRRLRIWLNTDIHLDHGLALLLKKAEVLYLDNVKGIKSILYDMDREGFQRLKHLDIENSDDIQYIINSTVQVPSLNVFPILESLSLNNLVSLEKICYGRLTTGPFTKLRILKVGKCNRLKSLFSFFMVRNLSQLQEMTVSDCQNMEEIVIDQSGVGEDNIEVAEFSQLRSLKLIDLPLLKSFCIKVKESMSDEVHNPRPLFDKMVSFPNLEELYVSFIDMKYLFTTSFVKSLLRLKRLGIYNCGFMERIVLTVAEEERLDKIIFSHLENLTLWYLPNLTSFCDGHFIEFCSLTDLLIDNCPVFKTFVSNRLSQSLFDEKVSFPNLEKFYVESTGCQDLKYLFTTSFVKSLLRLKTLQICKCEFMERIVLTEEFAEEERLNKIIFSDLENLILSNLPNLTNFCDGHLIEFCSLTNLRIDDCPVFKTFISNRLSQSLFDEKVSFPNLEKFYVESTGCQDLKYLFTTSFVKSLLRLKTLQICKCEFMERIVITEEFAKEERLNKIIFSDLENLTLSNLPNLTNFCDGHLIEFCSLTNLWIYNCPVFKTFVSNRLSGSLFDEKVSFPNLKKLYVRSIDMKYLFTTSFVKSLLRLKTLQICKCEFMERIVLTEEFAEEERLNKIIFSDLENLILSNLPNLTNFCDGHLIEFCSLTNLWIYNCPVFKTFVSNRLSGSLFDEKVAFSSLEHLTIISMSNLERIWHNQLAGGSFCMLKSMTVGDCKNLHTLFPSNDLRRFQKLEKLNLTNCDSLEEIYQLLEFNAEEESFAIDLNLRSMEIRDLKNLKNLFPASVAQNLLLLEKLSVDSCGVETIVAKAEGAKAAPSFVFPKLLSLNLTNLQDIRRFYLGIHSLEFPRLKDLKVHDCGDGMEFCSELFSLQGKHGEEYHHITIQQPLHLEKKVFPNLEELSLDGQMFEMIRWSDGQSFWIPSKITQSGKNVQDDEEN